LKATGRRHEQKDEIRAILSDQQRKRYYRPKAQGVGPSSPNVADWMQKQAPAQQKPYLDGFG
jgi:hypothetical protein